jgi:integrase
MALTDTALRSVKPGEKPTKLSDGGGLHLLVTPKGGKLWRLQYRFDGKQKTLALGSYPDMTLKVAREKRDDAKATLNSGVDPSSQRRIDKLTAKVDRKNTFDVVAAELVARKRREGKADGTLEKTEWCISLVRPLLGDRPIAELAEKGAPEILEALRRIEARGRLETAKRSRSIIGQVFRFAIATGRANNDPTQALRGAIALPRPKHRAAILDASLLAKLLRDVDGYDASPITRSALLLMTLLFPRPGELRAARWQEFHLSDNVWEIPPGRMKMRRPHRIPLPVQARTILSNLHSVTGHGEFVFASHVASSGYLSEAAMNQALRRMGYEKDVITPHGFRGTASTHLNNSGLWSADAIERSLAHLDNSAVRRAYNHDDKWQERTRMMQWWADHLDALRSQGSPS